MATLVGLKEKKLAINLGWGGFWGCDESFLLFFLWLWRVIINFVVII
jgi:hypothetical protein